MSNIKGLLRKALTVCFVLAVGGLAALMLLPMALGYERYVILSDSMTGTYDRGAIVYDKPVPVDELEVGDAITYAPPAGATRFDLVTHRIHVIGRAGRERVFRTKGDAVAKPDPWTFTLAQPRQARVDFSVPYAGFVIMALTDRSLRMLVIGLPALLIALWTLGALVVEWRRSRGERAPAPATAGGWVRL